MPWAQRMRIVKAGRVKDPYAPGRSGRITLDPAEGATVQDRVWLVECQPIAVVEESENITRVASMNGWRIISRPGQQIEGITAADGVLVDGVKGVLQVEGEVGQWPTPPRLAHTEFTVRRWVG